MGFGAGKGSVQFDEDLERQQAKDMGLPEGWRVRIYAGTGQKKYFSPDGKFINTVVQVKEMIGYAPATYGAGKGKNRTPKSAPKTSTSVAAANGTPVLSASLTDAKTDDSAATSKKVPAETKDEATSKKVPAETNGKKRQAGSVLKKKTKEAKTSAGKAPTAVSKDSKKASKKKAKDSSDSSSDESSSSSSSSSSSGSAEKSVMHLVRAAGAGKTESLEAGKARAAVQQSKAGSQAAARPAAVQQGKAGSQEAVRPAAVQQGKAGTQEAARPAVQAAPASGGIQSTSSKQQVAPTSGGIQSTPAVQAAPASGGGRHLKVPAGWVQEWSEEHKLHFYWNEATDESLWEAPAEWYCSQGEPAAVAQPGLVQKTGGRELRVPPGWSTEFSDEHGLNFYFNEETDESLWEAPAEWYC